LLSNGKDRTQGALEKHATTEMLHELQFQQTRYTTLGSNANATKISVPVRSIAAQFDASAELMENVSHLG
jgi:hypothetical protein